MILLVNCSFYLFIPKLISLIGLNYALNERIWTSISIFNALLLNTCLVPLLLQANFSADYPGSVWDRYLSEGGRNSDFGSSWYTDIGPQLTVSLILLSLQPLFNILAETIALKLSIWYKMNHSYGYHDNNHLDNIKFLEINAGPEYLFYIKTASLNAVLFITIVFGVAFPLFYSLALFAIIIQYVVERYTLAVFYRLPPKFSLDLTETNARVMTFAPLWSMAICFWMFGNHQMFSSEKVGMINKFNGAI